MPTFSTHFLQVAVLRLNDNKLRSLPKKLKRIRLPKLRALHLYGNPWRCTCKNAWLAHWLRTAVFHALHQPQDIRCATPTWLHGQALIHLLSRDMCSNPFMRWALVSLYAVFTTVFVIVFMVSCVYYNRVAIFVRCFWHPFDR